MQRPTGGSRLQRRLDLGGMGTERQLPDAPLGFPSPGRSSEGPS